MITDETNWIDIYLYGNKIRLLYDVGSIFIGVITDGALSPSTFNLFSRELYSWWKKEIFINNGNNLISEFNNYYYYITNNLQVKIVNKNFISYKILLENEIVINLYYVDNNLDLFIKIILLFCEMNGVIYD